MDEPRVARDEHHDHYDDEVQERRGCLYCLKARVFLGSIDHDGQEVYESVRCRRCDCTGLLISCYAHS